MIGFSSNNGFTRLHRSIPSFHFSFVSADSLRCRVLIPYIRTESFRRGRYFKTPDPITPRADPTRRAVMSGDEHESRVYLHSFLFRLTVCNL